MSSDRKLWLFDVLEQSLERVIEGSVGRILPSRIQPAEIARRLEREMMIHQIISVEGPIVPNTFAVHLHPADAAEFSGYESQLTSDLAVWLKDLAEQRDLRMVGPVRIDLEADATVPRRGMRIQAVMLGAEIDPHLSITDAEPDVAYLLAFSGSRLRPRRVPLHEGYTIIGRAPAADLVVDDPSVSRFHARIEIRGRRIDLRDLDSTNGTRLNGEPVGYAPVEAGDILHFGAVEAQIALNPAGRYR